MCCHSDSHSQALLSLCDQPYMSSTDTWQETIKRCFDAVLSKEQLKQQPTGYFVEESLLMRKWSSTCEQGADWNTVYQVVIPSVYWPHVLLLAHDHVLSGHLGITKTYYRIRKKKFWPGLEWNVARYCRTCQTCQCSGKPNQVIPNTPLTPIPIVHEQF